MKVISKNQEFYIDGYLKKNLDLAKSVIKKDFDMIFCCSGSEGLGKSVFIFQLAKYCDPNFNIDNIAFTPEEFINITMKANKYNAIVFDEAYFGLSARGYFTETNRVLVSMLAQIRQKNLFVFIVIPSFFDLDKYVAVWRTRALIHVYSHGFNRGYFNFYSFKKKKTLYNLGKKTYEYVVRPNFRGRFTNFYTVDEKEYRIRKLRSLTVVRKDFDFSIMKDQRNALIKVLKDYKLTYNDICNKMAKYCEKPLKPETLRKIFYELRDKRKAETFKN